MANHRAPVPTWLNKQYMEDILRNHLNKPSIEVQNISITPGSKEGDNYAYQVLRINLDYKDGDKSKTFSVIGKIKPNTGNIKAAESVMNYFLNEATVYNKLFPILKKFDTKPEKNFAPECYHVDYKYETIFLEDLMQKQYVMPKRGELLNKKSVLLTIEALASLHGASFRAVQADPSLKITFQKTMWGSKPNEQIDKWYNNAIKGFNMNLGSYGLTKEWCNKLRDVGNRLKRESFKVCDFKEGDLNVICHGDLWMNNLMYHFKDGVIDDVVILDYQFTTYNSFAIDLHFILFTSVQADVLINDLDTILETYYNKLKMVAPEIPNLTLERVKREFYDRRFFGCVASIFNRSVLYATTPLDIDLIVAGGLDEMGYKNPGYVDDLHKMLPFLEKEEFFLEYS